MNLYQFPKMNYGYPYCMTEFDLSKVSTVGRGLGSQWGHPTFMNASFPLDEYCQSEENNRPPSVPLPSDSLASSVFFYMGTFCSVGDLTTQGSSVGLPCNWTDTPIIANHGLPGNSGGHNVVRLHFDDVGHKPRWDKEPEVILKEAEACTGSGCLSPFGLAGDKFGRLYISSDETNEIFMVSRIYNQQAVQVLTDRANEYEASLVKGSSTKKEEQGSSVKASSYKKKKKNKEEDEDEEDEEEEYE